jgi:hypothetical protein
MAEEKKPDTVTEEVRISAADLADIRAKLKEASDAAKSAEARAIRAENSAAEAKGQAASAVAGTVLGIPAKDSKIAEFGGSPGMPFAMYGEFGDPGVVTLNGRVVQLTAWRDGSVKGLVPADMQPGPVKIEIDGQAMNVKAQLR